MIIKILINYFISKTLNKIKKYYNLVNKFCFLNNKAIKLYYVHTIPLGNKIYKYYNECHNEF